MAVAIIIIVVQLIARQINFCCWRDRRRWRGTICVTQWTIVLRQITAGDKCDGTYNIIVCAVRIIDYIIAVSAQVCREALIYGAATVAERCGTRWAANITIVFVQAHLRCGRRRCQLAVVTGAVLEIARMVVVAFERVQVLPLPRDHLVQCHHTIVRRRRLVEGRHRRQIIVLRVQSRCVKILQRQATREDGRELLSECNLSAIKVRASSNAR